MNAARQLGRFAAFGLGAALAGALPACAWFASANSLRSIAVRAEPGANRNMATRLDLVFLYRNDLRQRLPASGPEWFAQRAHLIGIASGALDVVSLEVPPERTVADVTPPARSRDAVAIVMFANYLGPDGQAPLALTGHRHAVIHLRPEDVRVAEQGAAAAAPAR